METDKEKLGRWLEDLEMVLRATDMWPIYIPTVREEWVKKNGLRLQNRSHPLF